MGMGGDFNQMQMMMAMQNGMGANGFGSLPLMGMCVQHFLHRKFANLLKGCLEWVWIRWRCRQ